MTNFVDNFVARLWNHRPPEDGSSVTAGLNLGPKVTDGQIETQRVVNPLGKGAEHLAVLGKTGSGKSYLLSHFAIQDIQAGGGFVCFDLHGDLTPSPKLGGTVVRNKHDQHRRKSHR